MPANRRQRRRGRPASHEMEETWAGRVDRRLDAIAEQTVQHGQAAVTLIGKLTSESAHGIIPGRNATGGLLVDACEVGAGGIRDLLQHGWQSIPVFEWIRHAGPDDRSGPACSSLQPLERRHTLIALKRPQSW